MKPPLWQMTNPPVALWHFTCAHTHARIGKSGVLLPFAQPFMPALGPIVWLTDDPAPERDDVGLSSTFLSCDRMQYRYRAIPDVLPIFHWSAVRDRLDAVVLADTERYRKPDTWWISLSPLGALLSTQPKRRTPT